MEVQSQYSITPLIVRCFCLGKWKCITMKIVKIALELLEKYLKSWVNDSPGPLDVNSLQPRYPFVYS